jgi:hypothetical protein
MEKEGGLNDLCLVVSHTSLLRALVKVGVVLGFFGMFFLGYFRFGFLKGR